MRMARTKAVPDPVSLDALEDVHEAIPLVPRPSDDCCARVQSRGPATTRESAQEWIAFLEALDLLSETDRGYERRRVDPSGEPLGERFRERVYGVSEVLDALADGPLTADAVFEEIRSTVPTWERNRHTDWERVWRDRTRRLLEWAVIFGLVGVEDENYALR
jgi:hypothetical protein